MRATHKEGDLQESGRCQARRACLPGERHQEGSQTPGRPLRAANPRSLPPVRRGREATRAATWGRRRPSRARPAATLAATGRHRQPPAVMGRHLGAAAKEVAPAPPSPLPLVVACGHRRCRHLDVFHEVDEFLLGVDVQLAVDVVDVRLRRADGYEELLGDVLRVPAADQHAEHLLLTSGELELLERVYAALSDGKNARSLDYTEDELAEGLSFIKSLVDGHVIMSLPTYYGSNGDNAAHQSTEWITGKLAGCFEWDSSATKYQDALDEENKPGFTVGEEIKFGDYNGGFSKVSMGLAITKTCEHPAEAATLINFLLNEEAGASIMGSECGIPASKAGLAAAQAAGAVKELVAEANGKVMAFVSNRLDPLFESNDLKANGTGVYQEVFDTVDYDNKSGADVVDILLDGMDAVGYTVE